jgi:hypothetical protein
MNSANNSTACSFSAGQKVSSKLRRPKELGFEVFEANRTVLANQLSHLRRPDSDRACYLCQLEISIHS